MKNPVRRTYTWLKVSLLLLVFASGCSLSVSLDTSDKKQPTEGAGTLKATFLGQDGGDFAGKLCSAGTKKDNVHIHLSGVRTDLEPIGYRVDDFEKGGVWATPCDPISNWFLYVKPVKNGETDLYFKPFRDAPKGTEYTITVTFGAGETQKAIVRGVHVKP